MRHPAFQNHEETETEWKRRWEREFAQRWTTGKDGLLYPAQERQR